MTVNSMQGEWSSCSWPRISEKPVHQCTTEHIDHGMTRIWRKRSSCVVAVTLPPSQGWWVWKTEQSIAARKYYQFQSRKDDCWNTVCTARNNNKHSPDSSWLDYTCLGWDHMCKSVTTPCHICLLSQQCSWNIMILENHLGKKLTWWQRLKIHCWVLQTLIHNIISNSWKAC